MNITLMWVDLCYPTDELMVFTPMVTQVLNKNKRRLKIYYHDEDKNSWGKEKDKKNIFLTEYLKTKRRKSKWTQPAMIGELKPGINIVGVT